MKISLSMDLGQLAEGMGTEATHEDARRLREVLVRSGFENLEDLPEGAWWRMVDEAFKDWRPTRTLADASTLQVGDRVEGGTGEDRDTGRIESLDGDAAFVAWDSGVKTPAALAHLRRLKA